MRLLSWLLIPVMYILIISVFTNAIIESSQDGNYSEEHIKGSYDSKDLINVLDVRAEVALISIDGEEVLIEEGEIYTIKKKKSEYSGTVKVLEIDNDKVITEVNLEKTGFYYAINILLGALVSIMFGLAVNSVRMVMKHKDDLKKEAARKANRN